MNKTDSVEFFQAWEGALQMFNQSLTPTAKRMIWNALAKYELADVLAALDAHIADPDRGRFMPKPADVIAKIEAVSTDGFIGAEEAWALFPSDESQTAFVTDEALQAHGATIGLDHIASRMTFKEVYLRAVAKAKAENRRPVYKITPGTDKQQLAEATLSAVEKGLITSGYAISLLPHIEEIEILAIENKSASPQAVIGRSEQNQIGLAQLTQMADERASDDVSKSHLAEINAMLGIRREATV